MFILLSITLQIVTITPEALVNEELPIAQSNEASSEEHDLSLEESSSLSADRTSKRKEKVLLNGMGLMLQQVSPMFIFKIRDVYIQLRSTKEKVNDEVRSADETSSINPPKLNRKERRALLQQKYEEETTSTEIVRLFPIPNVLYFRTTPLKKMLLQLKFPGCPPQWNIRLIIHI